MTSSHATRWLVVAVVGLATGGLTLAGQGVLPTEWNRLANSGAIWLAVSFAVGAWLPTDREAALGGLVTLLLALVSYYATARLAGASISSTSVLLVWAGTAVVGGPVFGMAGHHWRGGATRQRAIAAALLGAVFVAEGLHTVLAIPDMARTGWVEAAVGVILAAVLAAGRRALPLAVAALVPLSILGLIAFELIDRLLGAS